MQRYVHFIRTNLLRPTTYCTLRVWSSTTGRRRAEAKFYVQLRRFRRVAGFRTQRLLTRQPYSCETAASSQCHEPNVATSRNEARVVAGCIIYNLIHWKDYLFVLYSGLLLVVIE